EVVLAKCGRYVHEAGAVFGCNEIPGDDRKATCRARVKDRPAVMSPDQLVSRERVEHLRTLSKDPLYECRRDHEYLVAHPHTRVLDVGPYGHSHVSWQRPRRRRPDQQPVALAQRRL